MAAFPFLMLMTFGMTLFCSALLLFMVQPLVGKMILPLLGGTPEVWNTCMVFFQAMLLAGYAYSHLTTNYLGARKQAILHMGLLLVPFFFLPLSVNKTLIQGGVNPVPAVLLVLFFSVGVPFFVISTSAPLLQKWFSSTDHPAARDPYFLYGASNLGSMLALLGYPLLIEPMLRLGDQTVYWTIGYALLVMLIFSCAYCLWRATPAPVALELATVAEKKVAAIPVSATTQAIRGTAEAVFPGRTRNANTRRVQGSAPVVARPPAPVPSEEDEEDRARQNAPVTLGRRFTWIMLAAVPSSLMLGVTTYITTDIAAIPLLWVLPLALYLLSFIIVFAKVSRWTQAIIVTIEALVVFCVGMTRVHPLIANSTNDLIHGIFWITAVGLFAGCIAILWLRDSRLNHKAMILALPLLLLLVIFMMLSEIKPGILDTIALHLLMLFVVAMVCHGELAHDRPAPAYLTEFFLLMSVGGVVGGLFNALVAPVIFTSLAEYKVAMVVACLLLPPLLIDEKPTRFGVLIDIALSAVFCLTGVALILIRIFEEDAYSLDGWALFRDGGRGLLTISAAILLTMAWGLWRAFQRNSQEPRTMRFLDLALPASLLVLVVGLSLGCYSRTISFRLASISELQFVPLSASRLRLILMFGLPAILCYTCVERSFRFGLCVGALLLGASFCTLFDEDVLLQVRSFFGVLVVQQDSREDGGNYNRLVGGREQYLNTHRLTHGTTLHGKQFTDPELRRIPLTYYHRTGPIGQVMEVYNGGSFQARTQAQDFATRSLLPLSLLPDAGGTYTGLAMALNSTSWAVVPTEMPNLAVIGLGTGTMSCYAEEGQKLFFYDIDTKVRDIAQNPNYFTFWSDAVERGAQLKLFINDARLEIDRQVAENRQLQEEGKPPRHEKYKVLVVDAFSSDAIPIHLITKQALALYLELMQKDGIVAFHISNRYLNLEPVLAKLAEELDLVAYINGHDQGAQVAYYRYENPKIYDVINPGKTASSWVVLTRKPKDETKPKTLYLDRLWKDTQEIQKQKRDYTRIRKSDSTPGGVTARLLPLTLFPDATGLSTSVGMALNGACGAEAPWVEADPYLYREGSKTRKISTWTDDFSDLLSIFSW